MGHGGPFQSDGHVGRLEGNLDCTVHTPVKTQLMVPWGCMHAALARGPWPWRGGARVSQSYSE
jgi:hypothetical protein